MICVDDALETVLSFVKTSDAEKVKTIESLSRVLAEDICSQSDVPSFNNSSMDGFAVIAENTSKASEKHLVSLDVVDVVRAGSINKEKIVDGSAVKVMTGAMIPDGANAVVMVENTNVVGDIVSVHKPVSVNENVRFKGESVRNGDIIMCRGDKITPAHIGMLASLGILEVSVVKKPKVAILATGDELVDIDENICEGKIRNANSYSLVAQIEQCGGIPVNKGIAKDNKEDLLKKLTECLDCDIILTSGGVSTGDYDFVKDILEDDLNVDIKFWKVSMKPGKPILFGCLGNKLVFGLAGNPVSSMVNVEVFVRPTISRMQGCSDCAVPLVDACLESDLEKGDGRETFIRAITRFENGQYMTCPTGPQGSGILQSMVVANSLIVFPGGDKKSISAGENVKVRFLKD